ncbi:NACHT domain-containing protein [Nonomuraea rubra]|uniref:NACHT domain-containing protein n=1 Tax=Nonomuraea rubra TaxID=46180 RepID=UPI003F4D048B
MTVGWFNYSDAVKVLGGDGKLIKAIDRLVGGLLHTTTGPAGELVVNLFDVQGELSRLSGQLGSALHERFLGLGRYQRTQRIAAAHAVIVVTAFFDTVRQGEAHFGPGRLRMLRSEQAIIAGARDVTGTRLGDLVEQLLHVKLPCPGPTQPYEQVEQALDDYYRLLSQRLLAFLRGLRLWESMTESQREHAERWLTDAVPAEARHQYDELFHRLAAEVPEIAYWSARVDHQATRAVIGSLDTGLRDLRRLLESVASGAVPTGIRDALSQHYRMALNQPIISNADLPDEMTMPSLDQAYISPCFRRAIMTSSAKPSEWSWWRNCPLENDLHTFLFGYLTHPSATQLPLLVLGQPGAGKSVLTKILAARLPPEQFAVVRVPLREAPAEQDLQMQIEHAVRQATGDSVRWPALYAGAANLVGVVILDGFDELLQVTGVSSSNYLEKVARFQEREAAQGRPTAVIVTSRTVVAHRARLPRETVVIHLDPFNEAQIERWLDMWNRLNAEYFAGHSLSPLEMPVVARLGELACQPLLLLMLALYDMDGNPLRHEMGRLDRAQLYERLLVRFARREVRKSGEALSEQALERSVERELLRLSVVAFAMFNRYSQWATEEELAGDLLHLLSEQTTQPDEFETPLNAAELIVGRFFFVHESQAVQEDRKRKAYEFLHSTFGEYLVARLTTHEVEDLVAAAELHTGHARRNRPNDDFLHALLSHSPLSSRESVLEFLQDLIHGLDPELRDKLKRTLLALFHDALHYRSSSAYGAYLPARVRGLRTAPMQFATYSLNLFLLLTLAGGEVTGAELFPEPAATAGTPTSVVSRWRSMARLWRSQIAYNAWMNLVRNVEVQRRWRDGERDLSIHWAGSRGSSPPTFDLYWTFEMGPDHEARGQSSWMHEEFLAAARYFYFLCGYEEELLIHAVAPLAADLSRSLMTVAGYWPDQAMSPANALLRLWLLSSRGAEPAELAGAYADCVLLSQAFAPYAEKDATGFLDIVLGHLRLDAPRLRGVLTLRDLRLGKDKPEMAAKIRSVLTELGLV